MRPAAGRWDDFASFMVPRQPGGRGCVCVVYRNSSLDMPNLGDERVGIAAQAALAPKWASAISYPGGLPLGIVSLQGHWSRSGIGSDSAARQAGAWKGSAKYWVSCVTRSSANSMMLTE